MSVEQVNAYSAAIIALIQGGVIAANGIAAAIRNLAGLFGRVLTADELAAIIDKVLADASVRAAIAASDLK